MKAAGAALVLAAGGLLALSAGAPAPGGRAAAGRADDDDEAAMAARRKRLRAELKELPHRIVYESRRGRDWELMVMDADGSDPSNLTGNPDADELYPHASPDGRRIAFVGDEGSGRSALRSVYCMNADGTGRRLIAAGARHPCWGPEGRRIAYTPNEYRRFTTLSYATRHIEVYDLASDERRRHPNRRIHHLYALTWSPRGKWFLATVHGGMGYRHGDLAIEAEGTRVFRLKGVTGCRPDVRPDGRKLLWNLDDQTIAVADLDLTATPPTVSNGRKVVTCAKTHKVYHGDWSPDGKYIAFSHGPAEGSQAVGAMARGWHICVADARARNICVKLTTDGVSNKEPDWLPAAKEARP